MKFEELYRLSNLLGYYEHENETVFKLLANELDGNRADLAVKTFKEELNHNLLEANNSEGKRDIIAHYIFEFQPLLEHNKDSIEKPTLGDELEFENEFGGEHENIKKFFTANFNLIEPAKYEFSRYEEDSLELGQFIFQEIQIACFKFQLDFDTICKELKVPTGSIDALGYIYYYLVNRVETEQSNNIEMPNFIRYRDKLAKVENWARGDGGLLDSTMKWQKPKKHLAAFIKLLKTENIISVKRGENPFVNEYFYKRYFCDFVTDDLSGYKAKKYEDAAKELIDNGFRSAAYS
jgi:hypothetical protein